MKAKTAQQGRLHASKSLPMQYFFLHCYISILDLIHLFVYREESDFTDDCIRHCGPGSLRDFVTVLSLSFHSIFEGLAVGLETSTENVWKLFAGMYVYATQNKNDRYINKY